MKTLWHQSGVNREGEPFIQLLVDDEVLCQLTPAEAREHAQSVLQAAEASEQDAFMVGFAKSTIGVGDVGAARLLQEFRRFREETGKKGPASDAGEFIITDKHKKEEE